jgi:hypothetical protein
MKFFFKAIYLELRLCYSLEMALEQLKVFPNMMK